MFSKALLTQLEAERRRLQPAPALTPEGVITPAVHRALDAERERAIAGQQHGLGQALAQLRRNQAQAFHAGLAAAHFNRKTQEIMP